MNRRNLSQRVAELQDERDEWEREAKGMTAAFKDCERARVASGEANEVFYKRLRACAEALGWQLSELELKNDTGSWQEPLPEAIAALIAAVKEHERELKKIDYEGAISRKLWSRVRSISKGLA